MTDIHGVALPMPRYLGSAPGVLIGGAAWLFSSIMEDFSDPSDEHHQQVVISAAQCYMGITDMLHEKTGWRFEDWRLRGEMFTGANPLIRARVMLERCSIAYTRIADGDDPEKALLDALSGFAYLVDGLFEPDELSNTYEMLSDALKLSRHMGVGNGFLDL